MVYTPVRPSKGVPAIRINLYSDTQTRPTPGMRRAMAEAEVGDDVFREDPTVRRLEEAAVARTGKEAAARREQDLAEDLRRAGGS